MVGNGVVETRFTLSLETMGIDKSSHVLRLVGILLGQRVDFLLGIGFEIGDVIGKRLSFNLVGGIADFSRCFLGVGQLCPGSGWLDVFAGVPLGPSRRLMDERILDRRVAVFQRV